jgi:hypothetical protein
MQEDHRLTSEVNVCGAIPRTGIVITFCAKRMPASRQMRNGDAPYRALKRLFRTGLSVRKVAIEKPVPERDDSLNEVFGGLVALVPGLDAIVDQQITRTIWPDAERSHPVSSDVMRLNLLLPDEVFRAVG